MQAPVSVIIPCYCCTKTIGRAVQSVFQQSLPPVEVILVNDASPDDTLE
ncbi:MAG: glycosyltransferase family 2 protein, partial [Snowella sp.]